MVTCTESHYCAKSPSFPTCNDMLPNQAKTKQEYTLKQFQEIWCSQGYNLQMVEKDRLKSSYGELKQVTNPSENLK